MSTISPEEEVRQMEELFASILRAITELRQEIEDLSSGVEAGEAFNSTAATKTVQSVADLIGRCQKAEILLHDCRNRQAGIARGGYALDLDKARADIGCKLDSLRRCGSAKPVSQ